MKRRNLIIVSLVILICLIAIIGIFLLQKKHKECLDFNETVVIFPENRMLEFDETYYFNGTENIEDDMVTGIVWRVDYNGHVSAFKFYFNGDYFDYADFDLSTDETKVLYEYADSLEGDYVTKEYEGFAYGSVLYKYNKNGEKNLKKFSGLSSDYPSAKEVFNILNDKYKAELEKQ